MSLQSRVMTVQMCIGFAVSLAVFAAICGVALLVLAAVRRVWSSKLLQTQMHSSREGRQISANPRSDELEAPPTRGYADLSERLSGRRVEGPQRFSPTSFQRDTFACEQTTRQSAANS